MQLRFGVIVLLAPLFGPFEVGHTGRTPLFINLIEDAKGKAGDADSPAAKLHLGIALAGPVNQVGKRLILVILPDEVVGCLEIGDDNGALLGKIVECLNHPVLGIARVGRELRGPAVVRYPRVVAKDQPLPRPVAARPVMGHREGGDVGEAEVIHRVLAFAVLLLRLGRSLPVGIFAAGQFPAAGEPIPLVKIVSQPVGRYMEPVGQPYLLLAPAQNQYLLVALLDIPPVIAVVELYSDADRQTGELPVELVMLERPLHRLAHVEQPTLFASLHLVAVPDRIGHGQAVRRDFTLHHQLIGMIVNTRSKLRPELHPSRLRQNR